MGAEEPKPGWRDRAAVMAACRCSPCASLPLRSAAIRAIHRLAAVCRWVPELLLWLFRLRMNAGENTAGTCSALPSAHGEPC